MSVHFIQHVLVATTKCNDLMVQNLLPVIFFLVCTIGIQDSSL